MFYVYVLQSLKDKKYYIGYTFNLERRLQEHQREKSISTKRRAPFQLVYYEKYFLKNEAVRRERQIKSYKGGEAFRRLLEKDIDPIV